jgi:hypothetical protein
MAKRRFGLSRYAEETTMETVVRVKVQDNYHLQLEFATGEQRLFDAQPYLEKGIFQQLKNPQKFAQAYVAFDTVCWPGDLDISPETLYLRSQPLPSQIMDEQQMLSESGFTRLGD